MASRRIGLIRQERHIADDVRKLRAAFDGGRVDDHLVHRDGHGGVIAQHHHAQRIADEDQIDAGFVDGERAGIVVGGDHGDGFAALFLGVQGGDGNFFAIHVDSPSTELIAGRAAISVADASLCVSDRPGDAGLQDKT